MEDLLLPVVNSGGRGQWKDFREEHSEQAGNQHCLSRATILREGKIHFPAKESLCPADPEHDDRGGDFRLEGNDARRRLGSSGESATCPGERVRLYS